jgi:hypothetical protein
MTKRFLYFLVFAVMGWLKVGAHVKNALPASPPGYAHLGTDTLPKWVQGIRLLPNERLRFEPETIKNGVKYLPALLVQAAIPKTALVSKQDSILVASQLLVKDISDSLHLKNGSEFTVIVVYADRCREGAGLSRRLDYLINGRKIKLEADKSIDETANLDSAISSRLDLFPLEPNEFFLYNKQRKTLVLNTITERCNKEERVTSNLPDTWGEVNNMRILFEVVQRDYTTLQGVAYSCVDAWGVNDGTDSQSLFSQLDLEKNYGSMYRYYKKNYQQLKKQ